VCNGEGVTRRRSVPRATGGEVVGAAPDCPPGSATYLTPWMLHVWLVPNRYGRFAADFNPWSQLAVQIGVG